jgi:hypothetical protein
VVISLPKAVVIVADAMAWLRLAITGNAQGPIPTKQVINRVGRNCVPPNLAHLCVQRIALFGHSRRTATSISLMSALILWLRVVVGARACVNAFMFEFASSMPARFLRCCAQLFERMVIFLLVLDCVAISKSLFMFCVQTCHDLVAASLAVSPCAA